MENSIIDRNIKLPYFPYTSDSFPLNNKCREENAKSGYFGSRGSKEPDDKIGLDLQIKFLKNEK